MPKIPRKRKRLSSLTTAVEEGTKRDEYRTPESIFDGLGFSFSIDVCSPEYGPTFVPSRCRFTRSDNGLAQEWFGTVWMNPPFGKRNGQVPWLRKFFEHGDGIGLVNALTSAGWFHDWMPKASGMFFPRGKTKFIRPDGSIAGKPVNGIVLFSAGETGWKVLRGCSLNGMLVKEIQ